MAPYLESEARKWHLDLSNAASRVQSGRIVRDEWSCGVTKTIEPGDRVFLIKLGKEPRGIVGSGRADSAPAKGRGVDWETHSKVSPIH